MTTLGVPNHLPIRIGWFALRKEGRLEGAHRIIDRPSVHMEAKWSVQTELGTRSLSRGANF